MGLSWTIARGCPKNISMREPNFDEGVLYGP